MPYTPRFSALRALLLSSTLAACASPHASHVATAPRPPEATASAIVALASLKENDRASGFVARAMYVDDDGRPRGARFVHEKSGFVLDYVTIESVPQAMIYASTYATSDGGEPHTQEHLLLGKGNAGRWRGNVEHATFAESSAYTQQRRTFYHFNTTAGADAFWSVLDANMSALLHPDYSDEEIRREVRNFGVGKQADGTLALDEKGTVYNEMVRASEGANDRSWYAMLKLLYGSGHPLSNDAGGSPAGIRDLTPERIRAFHASHYQLGNMGGIFAFPSSIPLPTILDRAAAILDPLTVAGASRVPLLTEETLPERHPAPRGEMRVVDYPYATADNPSRAMLAWGANRRLSVADRVVSELFVDTFAGGPGSNLYKLVIDRKSRVLDIGATNVGTWTVAADGQPQYLIFENVATAHSDEASLRALRNVVRAELERIAAFADGSTELAEIDARIDARIAEARRKMDKSLETPPGFGERGTGESWLDTFDDLARIGGFKRVLVYKDAMGEATALTHSKTNVWRDRIRAWGLLETPYAVVGRPSPELRARLDRGREERTAAELIRLEVLYGTRDPKEALKKREAEIAAASDVVARAEQNVPLAKLTSEPPMTLDDSLKFTRETKDGTPRVISTFDTIKSATVGLLLRLDDVPEASLPWLGVLSALMSDVGVLRDGTPIPYDEVEDRLRREVLDVNVRYTTDYDSGSAELSIEASGNDPDETKRALGWARSFLSTPDWRVANLPRIRDVIEQRLLRLHDTMTEPEERWVEDVEETYRQQNRPVLLHSRSFLVRTHDAFLVSWRLESGPEAKGVAPFMEVLATAGKKLDRRSLTALANALSTDEKNDASDPKIASYVAAARALSAPAQLRTKKAGRDLARFLADIPDASLAADWASLCQEMRLGLATSPQEALAGLTATLGAIRHRQNARLWVVASTKHQAAIEVDLAQMLASLESSPSVPVVHSARPRVLDRARGRGLTASTPFVALMNPSTGNASLVHLAPAIGLGETREDELVKFLAGNVFNGTGTQSFYKRMWGAALAYSDYVYTSADRERTELYADRCADLPQLLRFAEAEVRRMPADPSFVDYAIITAFGSRSARAFEDRAREIAHDFVRGRTPDRTRAFHERLLALRNKPGLAEAMGASYVRAMRDVIPSLAGSAPLPPDAVYFTTGPEKAIAAYEQEIARTRGKGTHVLRLWARDFWDVADGRK